MQATHRFFAAEEIPYDEQEAEKCRRQQEQTRQRLQRIWDERRRQEEAEAAEARRRQEAERQGIEEVETAQAAVADQARCK